MSAKLAIPRLGLSVLVVDGDEEQGLEVAAVHLAGTSPIGGDGNSVVAGHRDSAFWPLRNVRTGDVIQIKAGRTFRYAVDSIRIVSPEDVSVLQHGNRPKLTLITCYPFRYVGAAPQRFIVEARLTR